MDRPIGMDPTTRKIREAMENDLETFIRILHPNRVLGQVHSELIDWWYRPGAKSHQLVLLPRDHQKSSLIAYRVAWEITRNPAIRIIYVSATSTLAIKQLYLIKSILSHPKYAQYWPEMLHPDETKREKWKEDEIAVDHPKRKEELIRDPTIFAAGLTTTVTGLHSDIIVFDDVVIDDNVETETGRKGVSNRCGYFTSIGGTEGRQWVVGTRYHPRDWYNEITNQKYEKYDEDGNIVDVEYLYETFERQVEDKGDGTGTFLWPREQRSDGKWFGFNRDVLSKKRAGYPDPSKFRAQYYNNPNDLANATITPDMFQYFERSFLKQIGSNWYFKGERLNIVAAIDFAYSLGAASDYTSIVVVGVNGRKQYFVLDIVRFKTEKISDYYDNILRLQQRWDFRKIRMEITAAQKSIVKSLINDYIRPNGLALAVDEHLPQKSTKAERIEAVLQPRYANMQMWHYRGEHTMALEEELVQRKPAHDDIKDALASAVDLVVAPSPSQAVNSNRGVRDEVLYHPRFGGIH